MAAPTTSDYLNQTTPAAPSGDQNIVFQTDGATPEQSITGYVKTATASLRGVVKPDGTTTSVDGSGNLSAKAMVGDSGSGGSAGIIPAPPSGSAAAGKFLKADGTYAVPPGLATGTVTSVALTVPAHQSVSGSPVTSAGTLAITDNNQSANTVFAGPTSGSAAAPGFRALVQSDLPSQPYDIPCAFIGTPPSSQVMLLVTFARAVTFSANFSGSVGSAGTNPTATASFTVAKNGTSVGGVSISTSGVAAFTTTGGSALTFAAGDVLKVTAPSSADATLANVAITFIGTR